MFTVLVLQRHEAATQVAGSQVCNFIDQIQQFYRFLSTQWVHCIFSQCFASTIGGDGSRQEAEIKIVSEVHLRTNDFGRRHAT